jgi:hypothetical protein
VALGLDQIAIEAWTGNQNKVLKAEPAPIRTKHEEKTRAILGRKIRALPIGMAMTSTKAAEKTEENTPDKKAGKSSVALREKLKEKVSMAPGASLACHAKFPYFLKMMRSSSSTNQQGCWLCPSKAPMFHPRYLC